MSINHFGPELQTAVIQKQSIYLKDVLSIRTLLICVVGGNQGMHARKCIFGIKASMVG